MKWPKAVAFMFLCCCFLLYVGCSKQGATQDQQKGGAAKGGRGGGPSGGRPTPVGVSTAVKEDVPVKLTGLGTITPYNAVTVRSRVDGQLMEVNFREGQQVQKGALLAVIDPRPFQTALEQAQAALARDQSLLRTSQVNLQRFQKLAGEGVVAQQQLDQQTAETGQYTGSVQLDEAAVNNAKLNLSYTQIKAPITGKVGLRLVDVGNIVHATDQNGLLVITQMQPIAVIFTLPEDQIPEVVSRMKTGSLPLQAFDRDDTTLLATGRLETIDNSIDTTTGTVRLKGVFDNRDGALWPNQFVNVHLGIQTLTNATVVPSSAIQHGQQNTDYVYVVDGSNKVEMRTVQQKLTQGDISVIAKGLDVGERVVTDGQDRLQNGMAVEPVAPQKNNRQASASTNANASDQAPAANPKMQGNGPSNGSLLPDANAAPTNSNRQPQGTGGTIRPAPVMPAPAPQSNRSGHEKRGGGH